MKCFDRMDNGTCVDSLEQKCRDYILPFFSTLFLGLAAHMFMLTNKISFGGDVSGLFEKGATYISGRWGLELIKWLMPDISMPWFNGLFALLLVSLAVCVIIELFEIKNRAMQIMLGAVFICFPAQSATICYMFTCAPYGLSMLMAVSSVYIFERWPSKFRWPVSALLIIFSCSIYQGYFAFASSFCVIIMIRELMDKKDSREVFRHGVIMLTMLVVSVALYGATVPVAAKLAGLPVLDAFNDDQSLLLRFAVAYSAYLKTFIKGYFGYINTGASLLAHLLLVGLATFLVARDQLKDKDFFRIGLLGLCLFLFPLSCYCIYLLSDNGYIHSLALFPFSSLYILMIIVFERYILPQHRRSRIFVCVAMCVIVFSNILFANQLYFETYLKFESKREFYSAMMAVVTQTEGFDESVKLAVVGEEAAMERDFEQYFELSGFQHPSFDITDPVHAEGFVNNMLGYELPFASDEELAELVAAEEVQNMAVYPYYGSVKRVGDYMVVHLG